MKSEYFVTKLLSDQLHIRTCINGRLQSHLSVKYPCPPSLHSFAKSRFLFSTKSIQNTKKTPMNEDLVKTWIKYYSYCHGMTKSVKVHRKDQSVNKNAILASFGCFFGFPDRNLIILYKIT